MAAQAGSADAELAQLLDRFLAENLSHDPELASSLGLDRGRLADAKARLNDRSVAEVHRTRAIASEHLKRLRAVERARLSPRWSVYYDSALFDLESTDAFRDWQGTGAPYVVDQYSAGAYQNVPNLLDTQHGIETKHDAEAYLARLAAFPATLDQENDRLARDVGKGIVQPDFIVAATRKQVSELAAAPAAESRLVRSLADKTAAKRIVGDFAARATKIYEDAVVPGLRRQIAQLDAVRPRATPDAGVWKLPDGERYYVHALQAETTTTLRPEDIHRLGLDLVAQLGGSLDAALRAQGLSRGTVGARLRHMFDDPQFRYPNTEEGRRQLLEFVRACADRARGHLAHAFSHPPKTELTIQRVPAELEAGTSTQYYPPSLDGSRAGVFWINLRDTAELPRFLVPTVVYHEGLPGHHLQFSTAYAAPLPMPIKAIGFTAYVEGWAVYAEQLADEWGFYANDPAGRVGYLHDALLRAGRLVVDTGLHAMRWTRARAIRYLADLLGDPESAIATEIDRYCVSPGQACAYMIGKTTWLRLRELAKAGLGARFDIRTFHDAALRAGAMPLTVLGRVVGDYIRNGR